MKSLHEANKNLGQAQSRWKVPVEFHIVSKSKISLSLNLKMSPNEIIQFKGAKKR